MRRNAVAKWGAIALSAAMMLSLCSITAFAAEAGTAAPAEETMAEESMMEETMMEETEAMMDETTAEESMMEETEAMAEETMGEETMAEETEAMMEEEPMEEEPMMAEETLTGSYSIHIAVEDWNACVDKAVVALDRVVTDLSGVAISVTEKKTALDWATFSIGEVEAPRTVTGMYLCDEEGNPVSGPSKYVAVMLGVNPDEGVPFLYNVLNFQLNEWCDPYELIFNVEYEGVKVAIDAECTGRSSDADKFEKNVYTASDGIEYHYATYTPEEPSKTLVVWLHGIGEGGTDTDITLMAAEVTALAGEEFQEIMGGANILVPQCPTYWMDGDGMRGNFIDGGIQADGTSFYTEALHEGINAYAEMIGAETIIIAGCSNGGYMTMLMAINYGDEYDAYVPICEALPDEYVTDEDIEVLKDLPMFFIYAQNDPLVVPEVHEIPTLERLAAAGAEELHIFAPADVHDTSGRFFMPDGQPYQYFGHGSWQYFFNNEAVCDECGISCWEWMASIAE